MKKICLLLVAPLLFLCAAVTDAQILQGGAPSSGCGARSSSQSAALPSFLTPKPVNASVAYCSVSCPNGSTLSCSVSGCSAQDCSRPGSYSYIVCNGQTTYCTDPCPSVVCTPGEWMGVPGGCCTPYKGKWWWYFCNSNGQWEETGDWYCYGTCEPIPPA
jgi:hypothetical protein